jgi:hypothetical protein
MPAVPPQIRPEFDLDGVRIELEAVDGTPRWMADGRLFLAFALPALALLATGLLTQHPLLAGLGLLLLIGGAFATDRLKRRLGRHGVVLDLERGRLHVEEGGERRTLHLGDVVKARWDCTAPTTRLILVRADGSEQAVVHVLRRGFHTPGITRKQREWVLDLLTRQLDDATRADVPTALRKAVEDAREG